MRVFAGRSVADPQRPLPVLDEEVAWIAGLDLHNALGLVDSGTWLLVQPYVLETVAIWTTARVAAARVSVGQGPRSHLYLLRRGEQLLRSADPYQVLRGWLPAETDLR